VQLGMLVGSLYNVIAFPNAHESKYIDLNEHDRHVCQNLRELIIPITHFMLMLSNALNGSPRVEATGLKYFFTIVGMVMELNLIKMVSRVIENAPDPFDPFAQHNVTAMFIWFAVELMVFFSTLVSNIIFLAIRNCVRHKIEVNVVPERRQLPD